MRNLKAFGLAALMALVLSAMFASAVQANPKGGLTGGDTATGSEDVTLHGDREGGNEFNFFEAAGAKVTCTTSTFTGTIEENQPTSADVAIQPHYSGCTASGLPVTVDATDCEYTFLQPTKLENGDYTGEAALYCPTGKSITVEVFLSHNLHTGGEPFAVFHIRPHEGNEEVLGGHLIYTPKTEGTWDEITVDATITKVPYVLTPSTKATDGVYRNTVTVSAWGDSPGTHGEQRDLWAHDEV